MPNDLTRQPATITYAAAQIAIEAAVARSRELDAPECIAIVDASSNLLAFARVDGAAVLARDAAIGKASTAAATGVATGSFPFEFGANLATASLGAIVNLGGGLPIAVQGTVLGGIGVGSGTTEQDIAVAEAGRDALLQALGQPEA